MADAMPCKASYNDLQSCSEVIYVQLEWLISRECKPGRSESLGNIAWGGETVGTEGSTVTED